MPRQKRDALKQEQEVHDLLQQSQISKKNVARLRALAASKDTRIAGLAAVMLEVATIAPYRRHRIRTLARQQRDVLKRMEKARLILPQPTQPESELHDVDRLDAWYEWVGLPEHHGRDLRSECDHVGREIL